MKHLRVLVVLLAVGVLGAVLVSTAIAEMGRGEVRQDGSYIMLAANTSSGVTGCLKLTRNVRVAAGSMVGQSGAHWVESKFAGLRLMYKADKRKAFSSEMAQQIARCRSAYKKWEEYAKKYEAALAKWEAKGCGGRR